MLPHRTLATLLDFALPGCPSGPAVTVSTNDPHVNCDGSFSMNVLYRNDGKEDFYGTDGFGDTSAFASIAASDKTVSIKPGDTVTVTITGKLKDPCTAGLTAYTIVPAAAANISIHGVPFKDIATPPAPVVAVDKKFSYVNTFTCCPAGPGSAAPPETLKAEASSEHVGIPTNTPNTVTCPGAPAPVQVTVAGKVDDDADGGKVVISATDTGGIVCVVPSTDIH